MATTAAAPPPQRHSPCRRQVPAVTRQGAPSRLTAPSNPGTVQVHARMHRWRRWGFGWSPQPGPQDPGRPTTPARTSPLEATPGNTTAVPTAGTDTNSTSWRLPCRPGLKREAVQPKNRGSRAGTDRMVRARRLRSGRSSSLGGPGGVGAPTAVHHAQLRCTTKLHGARMRKSPCPALPKGDGSPG